MLLLFLSLGNQYYNFPGASSACPAEPLDHSDRRGQAIIRNYEVHRANIEPFFADACGDQRVQRSLFKLNDSRLLQLLIHLFPFNAHKYVGTHDLLLLILIGVDKIFDFSG